MNLVPWENSSSCALAALLMREQERVTKQTLEPLFTFDLDTLKRQAACDALKCSEGMQTMKAELMQAQFDSLETLLTADSAIEL